MEGVIERTKNEISRIIKVYLQFLSILCVKFIPSSLRSFDPIPSISFRKVDRILVCNPDSLLSDDSSLRLLED